MNKILIAPCGMNCGVCSRYLGERHDVKSQGIRIAYCNGCRSKARRCSYIWGNCQFLNSGQLHFCYECKEFPCHRLSTLDKRYRTRYHMSPIENLRYIKENGINQFLYREEEKWKCPECGGVISCHNGICFDCGLASLKTKKNPYRWEDD